MNTPAGRDIHRQGRPDAFSGPPRMDLPTDRLRQSQGAVRRGRVQFLINASACAKLERVAEDCGANVFAMLLAAFKALLFRYTAQTEIVVGSASVVRAAALAGDGARWVRTTITGDPTFTALVAQVCKGIREAGRAGGGRPDAVQVSFDFREQQAINQRSFAGPTELSLVFEPNDSGLAAELNFDGDLFDLSTVQRLVDHFQTLLESVLVNPEQKLSRLPLLTAEERETMLHEWNRTEISVPFGRCVHEVFEAMAGRIPDQVALVFQEQQLTYRELNERANRLARRLRKLGVGPEVRVAICMPRSLDMVVALYAVHKAGGAYVPVDPTYPAERIVFVLQDAGVPVVLTQRCLASMLPAGHAQAVCVDDEIDADAATENGGNFASGVTPENLAYVIYTSGSTGKPKGVMVRHRNVVNFFTGIDCVLGHDPGTWLAVTSISFDISVLELFWTLTRGFKVVIHGDDAGTLRKVSGLTASKPALTIAEEISRHGVTHLQCTPSLAGMMLDDAANERALRRVKIFLFGGEPLPPSLPLRLEPSAKVMNLYGPTETTVWSLACSVDRSSDRISIGRPMANTRVYVLDRQLQPVPVGVPGELYIGGEGVTRGYLNRAELTEERFIREPFVDDVEARMYRTGDLVRFSADGSLDFLGRIDNQVKVRGHRIELGEIETVLQQQSGIKECVVSVWQAAPNDTRLISYFVPQPGAEPAPAELRQALKGKLPEYMVPALFLRLASLPLTPNGKIDRKALPPPTANGSDEARAGAADRCDSTLVLKGTAAGEKGPVIATLPLTEAQREIWIGAQISDEFSCSFNQSVLLRLRGPLDTDRLVSGLDWLVHRHEALRATFADSGDEQRLHATMPVALPYFDFSRRADNAGAELNEQLQIEAAKPFDLANGPLFRFQLVKTFANEHALLVTLHHIICDGGSLGVLLAELGEYYSGSAKGAADPAPLEKTYQQFVREQLVLQQSPGRDETEAFWLEQCSRPARTLMLPADRSRPARRNYSGAAAELTMDTAVSRGVRALGGAQHCSMTATLLAGCHLLLQRLTGQSEIVLGLPITARDGPGSERLVGHCVNFLPLRLDFAGDPSFAEHLEHVWRVLIQAIEHQNVTLGSLLQKGGSARHRPAVQIPVMFNVDCADQAVEMSGLATEIKANPHCSSRFDLSLSAAESPAGIVLRCEYSSELFDAARVEGWLRFYETLLTAAVTDPSRLLSRFPQWQSSHASADPAASIATARVATAPLANSAVPEAMSETEKRLAEIWCEVVLVDQVGRRDSFFDIGGHSLLATKVIARISKQFGVALPLRVVFEAPTIEELAAAVEQAQRERPKVATPVLARRSRDAETQKVLGRLAQLSEAELQQLIQKIKSTP